MNPMGTVTGRRSMSTISKTVAEIVGVSKTKTRKATSDLCTFMDQRIVDNLSSFTGTTLSFSLAIFNAAIDLISFSNIFVFLGRGLVTSNFLQEKKEAEFRYGLVRVGENAKSISFYGGEESEMQLLLQRFKSAFENLTDSYHMENKRQHKIQKYEEFVDKSLKLDLLHATAQRDKVFEQQKILNIENLEKNSRFMFRQKYIASIATAEELETLSNIPGGSPLTRICQVVAVSFRKRNLVVPEGSSLLFETPDKSSAIAGSRKLEHSDELRLLFFYYWVSSWLELL
ncbi:hypothetical protein P8452_60573 [Trifolium repens]|nr:hypothetical protein P8452_60573 [Trifolium repens]